MGNTQHTQIPKLKAFKNDQLHIIQIFDESDKEYKTNLPVQYAVCAKQSQADTIVKAVNCHDELLAALEALIRTVEERFQKTGAEMLIPTRDIPAIMYVPYLAAKSAIKKAKAQ